MDACSSTTINLEYSSDVLAHFSNRTPGKTVLRQVIESHVRERLVNWTFDVCFELKGASKTAQLAVVLYDLFISRREVANVAVLKLVVAVALMLAFKIDENVSLTPANVVVLCGNAYPVASVLTVERFMLETLHWDLLQPTAAEALPCQLAQTEDFEAFGGLLVKCDAYAALCYSDAELSKQTAHTIAAVSFCCALGKISQTFSNKGRGVLELLPEPLQLIFQSESSLQAYTSSWLDKLEAKSLLRASVVEKCQATVQARLTKLMSPSTYCSDSQNLS
jgi:hypothetical protein